MAQIFKSLPMGLFSSCGACMLEYVCPANRMLCWLVSHFGYWSLLSPNLLIDFFFLLSFFFSFFSVVWPDAGQEVTLLHGILGVIVLQRPWVWNLSSLMHQSSLVNLLPKHKKMAVFWIGCFWKVKFIISSNNWAKQENAKKVKRSDWHTDLDLHLIVMILKESSITELELHHQIIWDVRSDG